MRTFSVALLLASLIPLLAAESPRDRAQRFLEMYNRIGQPLNAVANEADWKAQTDVSEEHTGQRIGANEMRAAFAGSVYVIETRRSFSNQKRVLIRSSFGSWK
jgi:peptidyl-dipeptidase A